MGDLVKKKYEMKQFKLVPIQANSPVVGSRVEVWDRSVNPVVWIHLSVLDIFPGVYRVLFKEMLVPLQLLVRSLRCSL